MTRSRILLTGSVATAAAAALLLSPVAASAHTDNLYTWAFDPQEDTGGFATTSKTDAALTLLPADTVDTTDQVTGMEICDEVGYAVAGSFEGTRTVMTWDHTTGAVLSGPVPITIDSGELVQYVQELDTLADCTVITILGYDSDGSGVAIAKVDPTTGVATILVELPVFETESYTGLATAPDGTTYVFVSVGDYPNVALVDFETGTIGTPVLLNGLSTYFDSSGFTHGVDFDAAGALWAITGVDAEQRYHLVSFAADASIPSATPTDSGPYSFEVPPFVDSPIPLTTEGLAPTPVAPVTPVEPAKPVLAATGSEMPLGLAAGALALLVAGAAMFAVRRRSA